MGQDAAATLLLTRTDIAELARVQRPVVSQWASRYRGSDSPFPEPVVSGSTPLFRGVDVAEWLVERDLGNNPTVREDLAAHAVPAGIARIDEGTVFAGVTSMLYVRAATGTPLAEMGAEDLLDEAEELDPDDEFCFGEIEALGSQARGLAEYTDALTEAAFGARAAFERVLARRRRRGGVQDEAALSPDAVALCARILGAIEAASAADRTSDEAVFVDAVPGASDVLTALIGELPETAEPQALTAAARTGDARVERLALRRLGIHGWRRHHGPGGDSDADEESSLVVDGPAIYFAQFPAAGAAAGDAETILDAIDDMVLQMSDGQWGLVIAPSAVLIDEIAGAADGIRAGIVRSDRLRAAVRLPAGLLPARAPMRMALWVLGPGDERVRAADRWTVVADLPNTALNDAGAVVLVADLVASLGAWDSVRAHAFGFGAVRPTASLLASGTLLPASPAHAPAGGGADAAARVIAATDAVNDAADAVTGGLSVPVEYGASAGRSGQSTRMRLGELVERGLVRRIPGNRIDGGHLVESASGAAGASAHGNSGLVRVLGAHDLRVDGAGGVGTRWGIDRLVFSAEYPHGRYTEPRDLVVGTGANEGVLLDQEGLSVVCAPAWVLRCAGPPERTGLLPSLIAEYLRDRCRPRSRGLPRSWRSWAIPILALDRVAPVAAALADLAERRRAADRLKSGLGALTSTLVEGVAGGALTLSPRGDGP